MAIDNPSNVGDNPGMESQAQSTSAEPRHKRAQAPDTKRRGKAGADTEIQFFDGTITKLDKDGNTVMSDHLAPGERLRREETDRYEYTETARKQREADEEKAKKDNQ